MLFSNPFSGAFGLDIGDLSIKLIQLSKSRRIKFHPKFGLEDYYKIKEMRTLKLPPGYIVNGEIQQPENVRKKLLHILGKEGELKPINSPWVVADLPEPKTFLKLIEIDTAPQDLTEDDVFFQAKKHLPFDLEEAHLDWQLLNNDGENSKVSLGAVPKVISDSYTYLLESVGLTPVALEVEALSIARSMVTANKDYTGQARAILDLGATRSCLIIYDHDTLQFSTNIDFSGEILTTAIAQGLNIDREEAEKLKIKNGIAFDENNIKYLKIVAEITDGLIVSIKKYLEFYQSHFSKANPITHITLCGGVSATRELPSIISRQLKISARPGNAWKNLYNPTYGEKERIKGLAWSSAIGLAIRAIQNPF